ncbi:hypothetical protein ABPG75_014003 [Micractinium tetrahymenae]
MRACTLLGWCLLLAAVQGPHLAAGARWLAQAASSNPFLAPAGGAASPTPAAAGGGGASPSPPPAMGAAVQGGGPIPPAAAPMPSPAAAPAPEAVAPLSPAAVPAAAPAAAPAPEAEVAAVTGPCACTATGVSGGANTSTVGCGQWDLVSGSNRFTCFVVDPAGCAATGSAKLAQSAAYPGAALRACTVDEAQPFLPTVSQMLVRTPQLASFVSALRMANLSSIPGDQVTICAPSNQAFNAAVYSGKVTRDQLQASGEDPVFLQGLIRAAIVPARATLAQASPPAFVPARAVRRAIQPSLPLLSLPPLLAGQTLVGDAGVVLPDLLAQNGIVHITGATGLLSAPDLAAQLAGGCACTATGRSGSVQTGEAGCAPRTDSGFLFPVSLCYVSNPAACATSLQSTRHPGAAWKLC